MKSRDVERAGKPSPNNAADNRQFGIQLAHRDPDTTILLPRANSARARRKAKAISSDQGLS
jgi:hypothetical protein